MDQVLSGWLERFGAFEIETPPALHTHAHHVRSQFEMLGLSIEWAKASGTYCPRNHFIVASLTPTPILQCSYGGLADAAYQFAGDVMWVPPHADLHCRWAGGAQKTIACTFTTQQMTDLTGEEWRWERSDQLAGLDVRSPSISIALRRIAEEIEAPGFASDIHLDCTLTFMLLELRRHLEGWHDSLAEERGKLTRAQITKLRDAIDDSSAGAPSLSTLAAKVGMSARQLSVMFRNTTQMTLRGYIASARMRKAQNLLLNRRVLIKEICFQTGFGDPASFSAAFRASTGMTPSEFRRRHELYVEAEADEPVTIM